MQNIIATWKKLEGEADKKAFLEQIQHEVGAKSGEQLLGGLKAIRELVSELLSKPYNRTPQLHQLRSIPPMRRKPN